MSEPLATPDPERAHLLSPVTPDGTAWTWRFRADFAPWIRDLRLKNGLTLKDAAERMRLTFTRLQKLETGGRVRAPSLDTLGRVASLYGRELDEVLARAGYKMEVPAELRDAVRCDDAFAALVLHPELRPACMDERWVESYSRIQKAQWVEFARKLDAAVRRGGVAVEEVLDDLKGANDGGAPAAKRKVG